MNSFAVRSKARLAALTEGGGGRTEAVGLGLLEDIPLLFCLLAERLCQCLRMAEVQEEPQSAKEVAAVKFAKATPYTISVHFFH